MRYLKLFEDFEDGNGFENIGLDAEQEEDVTQVYKDFIQKKRWTPEEAAENLVPGTDDFARFLQRLEETGWFDYSQIEPVLLHVSTLTQAGNINEDLPMIEEGDLVEFPESIKSKYPEIKDKDLRVHIIEVNNEEGVYIVLSESDMKNPTSPIGAEDFAFKIPISEGEHAKIIEKGDPDLGDEDDEEFA